MRKSVLIGVVVAASLALSACGGGGPAAKKAALKQFVASLGASPNVQVHFTASFTGAGSTAKVQSILKSTSLDVNVSNPSGAPISQASGTANTELIFNLHSTPFLDVRIVSGNIYLKLNVAALSSIPGTNISATQAAAVQTFLGNRWFELPKGLLHSLIQKSRAPKAQVAADQKVEAKVIDALTAFVDKAPYKTLSNGFSQSGSLQSVVTALEPTIQQLAHTTVTPKAVKGSYSLVLTTSGSTVTGASISVTAPNGTKGNATGTLSATVTHTSTSVAAPANATKITKQLLAGFGLGGSLG